MPRSVVLVLWQVLVLLDPHQKTPAFRVNITHDALGDVLLILLRSIARTIDHGPRVGMGVTPDQGAKPEVPLVGGVGLDDNDSPRLLGANDRVTNHIVLLWPSFDGIAFARREFGGRR